MLGAAALSLVSAGIGVAMTPNAALAAAGQFTLCAHGGYSPTAVFPDRGGLSITPMVGTCTTANLGGNTNERVDIYVDGRKIGSTIYNGAPVGTTVVTIPGPSFYTYNG
ncbi:hypothetical protein GCM10027280_19810 [Micromonospora polyrhachis]